MKISKWVETLVKLGLYVLTYVGTRVYIFHLRAMLLPTA